MDLAGVYLGLTVMKGKKVKSTTPKATSIWESLKQAVKEVRLHKEGKIKLKTAQELLDKL